MFTALLAVFPFAIWRIAKRTGHGRLWDVIGLVHVVLIYCLILSVGTYDPIEPYCDPSFDPAASTLSCAIATTVSLLGWLYIALVFLLPAILTFKKWPKGDNGHV